MEYFTPGDIVILTKAYDIYRRKKNKVTQIIYTNRLAKLEEIINWESEKGKLIKKARIESGKWDKLPLEDNKYIFSIYYPEVLGRNEKLGVVERGVPLFSKDPETGHPFFIQTPDWLYQEFYNQCLRFDIIPQEVIKHQSPGNGQVEEKDSLEWDTKTNLEFIKKVIKNK